MQMWFLFAVLSALFAALTSILAKVGIEDVNSNLATAIRTVVVVVMSWGMVFLTNTQSGIAQISKKSWIFLILSGLATGASWLCYYRAMQLGEVSKVVPVDKVVLMAYLYNAPELITGYCMRECPVHGFLPLATEEKSIQGITLRLLRGFNEDGLRAMKEDLIEITEDGIISREELPKLKEILEKLEKIAEIISEMKIAGEKYIKGE